MTGVRPHGGAQTVDRALEVWKLVALADRPVLLEELASRAQLSRSVTYRLVRSLERAGFVSREPPHAGYAIGATFVSMSMLTASRFNVSRSVRTVMEEIAVRFGETVSFHVRHGDQRVCTATVEGTHAVRRVIQLGEKMPLYMGETGRVLLSVLSPGELDVHLESAVKAGNDARSIRDDINNIRDQRYLIGVGLRTPGVGSISVPMTTLPGVPAAMTISGPVDRWGPAEMAQAVPFILDALARCA